MDQVKIGSFIRSLRKAKGLTQEQAAEQFHVSRRTVSRWETGSNLPDLDVLIEMSDYYGVELRELLDGERKDGNTDQETEETVLKVAAYSSEDKLNLTRQTHRVLLCGCFLAMLYLILHVLGKEGNLLGGLCVGFQFGLLLCAAIETSKYAAKIKEFRNRILKKNEKAPEGEGR
jgi:transcriptional regulator with XRE-family HTH domain